MLPVGVERRAATGGGGGGGCCCRSIGVELIAGEVLLRAKGFVPVFWEGRRGRCVVGGGFGDGDVVGERKKAEVCWSSCCWVWGWGCDEDDGKVDVIWGWMVLANELVGWYVDGEEDEMVEAVDGPVGIIDWRKGLVDVGWDCICGGGC